MIHLHFGRKILSAKIVVLHIAKIFGLFFLSRKLTAHGVQILCYHGFSFGDEHLFRSKLFMQGSTFSKRLAKLKAMKFKVVSLESAVACLKDGKQHKGIIAITIDDGWQSTESIAMPLLKQYNFPWTLYITSYYSVKQTQVMNVALQYLCWKTTKSEVVVENITESGKLSLPLDTDKNRIETAAQLSKMGDSLENANRRQDFIRTIAKTLCVNQPLIEEKRMFHLINPASVKQLASEGVGIQLHTHRHTVHGIDRRALACEIEANRNFIVTHTKNIPHHFCYPSGFYKAVHPNWLQEFGLLTATTCKPGFNYRSTSLMELNRFLDGENISMIEFEAEVSGFLELARRLRKKLERY